MQHEFWLQLYVIILNSLNWSEMSTRNKQVRSSHIAMETKIAWNITDFMWNATTVIEASLPLVYGPSVHLRDFPCKLGGNWEEREAAVAYFCLIWNPDSHNRFAINVNDVSQRNNNVIKRFCYQLLRLMLRLKNSLQMLSHENEWSFV